jgi:hypothetical protein
VECRQVALSEAVGPRAAVAAACWVEKAALELWPPAAAEEVEVGMAAG